MIEHKAERESLPVIHLIVNQSKDGEQMAGSQILSTGSWQSRGIPVCSSTFGNRNRLKVYSHLEYRNIEINRNFPQPPGWRDAHGHTYVLCQNEQVQPKMQMVRFHIYLWRWFWEGTPGPSGGSLCHTGGMGVFYRGRTASSEGCWGFCQESSPIWKESAYRNRRFPSSA